MVVLPRHRRRSGNPYGSPNAGGNYSSIQSPGGAHPNYNGPAPSSSRISSNQILMLIVGMGLGYLVTINMGSYNNTMPNKNQLDTIVKRLESQRSAASAKSSMDMDAGSVSSPMNMMNTHRDALLRGDKSAGGAASSGGRAFAPTVDHRSLSSDNAEVEENGDGESAADEGSPDAKAEDEDATAEKESNKSKSGDVAPDKEQSKDEEKLEGDKSKKTSSVSKKKKHHTFREIEVVDEDLSEAQKRFVETQKLIASQSIPTATNPHVMKTVSSILYAWFWKQIS